MSSGTAPAHKEGREFWGPRLWYLFHTFSANIDLNPDTIVMWQQFFKATLLVMNCDRCKKHFADALGPINISKLQNKDLRIFLFNQHNTINKSLARPTFMYESLDTYNLPLEDEERKPHLQKISETIETLYQKFMTYEQSRQIQAFTARNWHIVALRFLTRL